MLIGAVRLCLSVLFAYVGCSFFAFTVASVPFLYGQAKPTTSVYTGRTCTTPKKVIYLHFMRFISVFILCARQR